MTRIRSFWPVVTAIWATLSLLLVLIAQDRIASWAFPDPDDTLRLLQVRDWLGGQGWFDVTQYRVSPPAGGAMHWSRLVDLPIAAVELVARGFVDPLSAERVALVVVPLLTLGAAMATLAALARRVLPDEQAIFAVLLMPLAVDVLHQLRPMRIDHHGWQLVAGLVIALALTQRGARGGLIAGSAAALWLAISVEGLPFVAGMLAFVGLRWASDRREQAMLLATIASVVGASVLLFAALRASPDWSTAWCDAMSPIWLAMLSVAGAGVAVTALLDPQTRTLRMVGLGASALAALVVLPLYAPHCLSGPFATLDPIARDFWDIHVLEGQPIWKQNAVAAANALRLPLVGLVGSAFAFRASGAETRRGWATLVCLLAIAVVVTVQVQRGSGLANLLALPGASWAIGRLLVRARIVTALPLRLAATTAAILLAVPGLLTASLLAAAAPRQTGSSPVTGAAGCSTARDMAVLDTLPPATILAPIDAGPAILVLTRHRIVASAHHRGGDAIADTIRALSSDPAVAHAIVRTRGVGYIVVCPSMTDADMLAERNAAGLWARLRRGDSVDWLEPVVLPQSSLKVWRVTR